MSSGNKVASYQHSALHATSANFYRAACNADAV